VVDHVDIYASWYNHMVMHSGGHFGGAIPRQKTRSSAQTGLALAAQERRAASARLGARAGGCVLAAAVETAALEMTRVLHRDALKLEAARDMRAGRPALTRATKAGA
jgi:hypothetical protein